jgi:Lysylphosphatidylglycerol synthase TM region
MMLQRLGARIWFGDAAVPFMASVAFNNVLPFRAGDMIRILAFKRFTKVDPSAQFGTLVLERLFDLLVLGLSSLPRSRSRASRPSIRI